VDAARIGLVQGHGGKRELERRAMAETLITAQTDAAAAAGIEHERTEPPACPAFQCLQTRDRIGHRSPQAAESRRAQRRNRAEREATPADHAAAPSRCSAAAADAAASATGCPCGRPSPCTGFIAIISSGRIVILARRGSLGCDL